MSVPMSVQPAYEKRNWRGFNRERVRRRRHACLYGDYGKDGRGFRLGEHKRLRRRLQRSRPLAC